jgi:polysaccharide pyruvyl transferase CsaB
MALYRVKACKYSDYRVTRIKMNAVFLQEFRAGHLITLINDPEKRRKMGEALYKTAHDHFSLETMKETQLSIYRNILAREKQALKDGKKYDIAILGYYGFRNSGDDAILKSIIDNLRIHHKRLSTVVLSNDPYETRSLYRVQSIHRFNLIQIPSLLAKTRVFIAGGGTLIQDDTSSRSLWYYLFMLHLAIKKGAHVVLLANGLGPLTKKKNRKVASAILNRMDAITLRDPNAYDELMSLNVKAPITKVTADPALALEPCDPAVGARILKDAGLSPGSNIFALCFRKWKKVKHSEKILAAFADKIVTDFNAVPVFVAMQHPGDVRFAMRILRHMKQKGYVLTERFSVEQTLSVLANASIVIGMRLHSLIYATNLGIPMVGLAYEPKINYFMNSINQPFVPWNENFSMENLIAKTRQVIKNAPEIRAELVRIKPLLESKVKEAIELTLTFLPQPPD